MVNSDSSSSPPPPAYTSPQKDGVQPVRARITDLNQSQMELMDRLKGLKVDLQSWRTKLDTQVKTYKEELSELKKTLDSDIEKLRSEFTELRTTLQKQQEDVTSSLRTMGLQDKDKPEHIDESHNHAEGDSGTSGAPAENGAEDATEDSNA